MEDLNSINRLRIALIDSNDLVIEGYKRLLSSRSTHLIVYHSSGTSELLSLFDEINPDVVIIDFNAHDLDALEFLDNLSERSIMTKVIVSGSIYPPALIKQLLKKGAYTYFLKNDTNSDEFISILEKARENKPCYTSIVTKEIVLQVFSGHFSSLNIPELSTREVDILILLCHGRTRDQISVELFISPHTVKYHIQNILNKTELSTVLELVTVFMLRQWFPIIKYRFKIWQITSDLPKT